ncbi:MAG: hypothetical protein HOY69_40550 [Streptomyces sp.]|nr:hypothetical protein [Streptomyces sp.]
MQRESRRRPDGGGSQPTAAPPPRTPGPLTGPAALLALQRSAGNQAVARQLARDAASPAPPAPPLTTRLDEGGLRSLADPYVNAEYAGAAREALEDVERLVSGSFDFGSFFVNLAGNLIWAAACFTQVGVFGISVAGILVSAGSPAASTALDKDAFHSRAQQMTDTFVGQLMGFIPQAAHETYAEATARGLDDAATRRLLLQKLFRPEFIAERGGLPFVDRPAIRHRITVELLERANAQSNHFGGPGRIKYDYTVWNHYHDAGLILTDNKLDPPDRWRFTRSAVWAYLPEGGRGALDELAREQWIDCAALPWPKTVYLSSSESDGHMEIMLDANNRIEHIFVAGIFEDLGKVHQSPRSMPVDPDREGATRTILARLWPGSGGRPEAVEGGLLWYAGSPGRSFATR